MSAWTKRWGLVSLVALLPFALFWRTGLFDVDEGFYAAIESEMRRNHDWIIPRLNGLPWFEKPILIYWLMGGATWLFGEVVGPRAPSILASLGTLAIVGRFVARQFDLLRAQIAVLILSGSLLFVAVGQLALTDPELVFGWTGALLFWLESRDGRRPIAFVMSALCLGIALLAKGPVAVFLFAATVVWTYRAEANPPLGRGYSWALYALVVAAMGCIWYVPAYLGAPKDFVEIFVLKQNVGRLLGGDDAHRTPWWLYLEFYVIVLGVLFAPWFYLLRRAWPWGSESGQQGFVRRALGRAAWMVFGLFTLGGSKLPHYILPALVPLAIVIATSPVWDTDFKLLKLKRVGFAMTVASAIALAIAMPHYAQRSGQAQSLALAKIARQSGDPIVLYQLRARQRDVSFKPTAQETSLPSLNFYLNQSPREIESLADLKSLTAPTWIFTRDGRLGPQEVDDLIRSGHTLAVDPASADGPYELIRLRPASGQ